MEVATSYLYYINIRWFLSGYSACFQSIIRYSLVVWDNASQIDIILRLQKKSINPISNVPNWDHCQPLFIKLIIKKH